MVSDAILAVYESLIWSLPVVFTGVVLDIQYGIADSCPLVDLD
jgi:hypothetical protein